MERLSKILGHFSSTTSSLEKCPTSAGGVGNIVPVNRLKYMMLQKSIAVGTFLTEAKEASVTQVLSNSGMDFIIIDGEHGVFSFESVAAVARAAKSYNLTPIYRIPQHSYSFIAPVLDCGVQGILVPRVETAAQIADVVRAAKFPPLGIRGGALNRGYTDFRGGSVVQAMEQSNRESLIIVQIETAQAMTNLDAILKTPGVDAALIGPHDLSIALGVPGQDLSHPVMSQALKLIIAACSRNHIIPCLHLANLSKAEAWLRAGIRVIAHSSELGFIHQGASFAAARIKEEARHVYGHDAEQEQEQENLQGGRLKEWKATDTHDSQRPHILAVKDDGQVELSNPGSKIPLSCTWREFINGTWNDIIRELYGDFVLAQARAFVEKLRERREYEWEKLPSAPVG